MVWWLRVRRAWVLALGLIAVGAVPLVTQDQHVMVPTAIGGGTSAILWSTFLPLGWAAVLSYSFELRGVDAEARASLRLAVLDVALVSASTAAVIGILWGVSSDAESSAQIAAHVLIVAGVAVGVATVFGAGVGILATTMLILLTFSYGVSMSGARYVRVLQPEGETAWSLLLGVVLFAAALCLILVWRHPLRGQGAES